MAGVQQGLCGMLHGMLTVLSGEAKPCLYNSIKSIPHGVSAHAKVFTILHLPEFYQFPGFLGGSLP